MRKIIIAFRSLFKKGQNNGIKIVSLGVGLAMGLVLISKVCFERSYDNFYQDSERIYRLHENINQNGELKDYGQVSGAVAPAMKAELPEVEASTRLTYVGGDKEVFTTADKERYAARFVMMADSNVFDLLPVPILIGEPKEILTQPSYAMVSRRIAERMGGIGNVVGKTIEFEAAPGVVFTIGGVFENVPENSHLRYEVLVSLNGMDEWSRNNWIGNDRYLGYVKLYPGVVPESIAPAIRKMQERHQNLEELKKSGLDLSYSLVRLSDMHSNTDKVKNMNVLLGFLAFILIFTAVMNYVLIVLSTLIGRTKEVAVHKCYGASDKNLFGMIMSETFLHLVLSMLLAGFLIIVFQSKVEELLGASLGALFTVETIMLLMGVCILVFVITGLIPTYLFLRIPVAAAFRNIKISKRYWKLCLLFVQFIATAYLVTMLIVINRQYDRMVNDDPGYGYEKLLYYDAKGVNPSIIQSTLNELANLPEVDKVSVCTELPLKGMSGNNVQIPGDDRELFNIADMYFVGDNFFQVMEIPLIEGDAFSSDGSASDKVMVSRSFADKMAKMGECKDGVLGKSFIISEHSQHGNDAFTVCGIYENIRIGTIATAEPDVRPTVVFYGKEYPTILLIKLHQLSSEGIAKVTDELNRMMPGRSIEVTPYKTDVVNLYSESRYFRDSILIGGLVTLIIALIGLLGYTSDETKRRGREIAIRKVNGATAWDILCMISKDISFIAIPALVVGVVIARISGQQWLEKFAEKVPLNIFLFLAGALVVYAIIIACVLGRAWYVANENPVDSIKSE